MVNTIQSYAKSFARLFYPVLCAGCGTDLVEGEAFLCMRCNSLMAPVHHSSAKNNPVLTLFEASIPLTGAVVAYYYSSGSIIQQLIHRVKYNGKRKVGEWLGRRLGSCIMEVNDLPVIDLIIPVPLHPSKLKKRGYNQCDLLCRGVGSQINRQVLSGVLVRRLEADSQTHESRIGRWENVRNSFTVNDPECLQGKTILLVDDVVTTGSTMLACARTLLKIDGCKVCIAAVAISGEL